MLLRLAIWLSVVTSSELAWAEPGTPDPTSLSGYAGFLRDNGVYGAIVIVIAVAIMLWRQNQALVLANGVLRDRRGDEADARAERFAKVAESSSTSAEKVAKALEGVEDKVNDALDIIKLQPAATDAILKGQDQMNGTLNKNADKLTSLLGSRA